MHTNAHTSTNRRTTTNAHAHTHTHSTSNTHKHLYIQTHDYKYTNVYEYTTLQYISTHTVAVYLHSLLVLAQQLGGKLTEDLQEGQVDGRKLCSTGVLELEGKLYTIPEGGRGGERERQTDRQSERKAVEPLYTVYRSEEMNLRPWCSQ